MRNQNLASIVIVLILTAGIALAPATVGGQTASVPRTSWGEPDLQGVWDFRTATPMERPDQFSGQEFLTAEEASQLEQQAVDRQVDRAPRAGDPGTYNQFWMDGGKNVTEDRRTS